MNPPDRWTRVEPDRWTRVEPDRWTRAKPDRGTRAEPGQGTRAERDQWTRIEAALDEILALPDSQWTAACARIAGDDVRLRDEISTLLACAGGEDPILDRPLTVLGSVGQDSHYSLSAGTRVGAYRIVAPLGRGGMAEVYRAERADGQFEQQVALKLMQREAAALVERFQSERQMLARLEHPGIARLHDGGLADDGRPYMVMELVDGRPIIDWCRERRSDLVQRLALFMAICNAVAYAHRNLVVHRDLQPANVLVTQAGEVKLLDFGVAKLLGAHGDEQTQNAPMTPAYAAPEQLTRGAITTATDVYALGMLLFELLSGTRPWRLTELPLVAGLDKVLREAPPAVSAVAEQQADAPVAPALLRGDLDAIVAKALRKEPEHRYETVSALQADIAHSVNHEPVAARAGARLYVLGRFVRRHRLLIAGSGLLAFAVAAGVIGVTWQAARAEREAARAEREAERAGAVKDFLVSIFRASDPRVASNQPRGQITAKALLDDSTGRIDQEFNKDPDLEIELLGTVEGIYALLNEGDHADALHRRRVALARATYGDLNPIVIDSMLDEVAAALRHVNLADARGRLDRLDGLIRQAGLDHSAIRARWWLQQGQVLWSSQAAPRERTGALTNAVNLYAAAAPANEDYPVALNELGQSHMLEGDFNGAIACFERGITVAQREPVPDDSVQVTLDKNLAQALRHENQRTRAEQLLASATGLAARTYGMDDRHYWEVVAAAAQMIHEDGNRGRAMDMFGDLMRRVPGEDGPFNSESDSSVAARVREIYGSALTVEGRPQLGIGLLESAERVYTKIPRHGRDLPRLRMSLGDAYDRVGRDEDARRELESALDGQLGQASPSGEDVLAARERWGRFLLAHGELAGAEVQLRETLGQARGRSLVQIALAQGDIARLDIARHDASAAARDAQLAVDQFELVQGFWAVPVAHLRPSAAAGRRPGERAALGEKGTRC